MMPAKGPALVPFNSAAIPQHLKDQKRWAPWRAEWNPKREKYDKIPHRADRPDYGISSTRPEQWFSFEAALAAFHRDPKKFAGIGYVVTGAHDVVGVDLDHCVEAGVVAPWAAEVVAQLDSYTEISPSGTGLRVMVRGAVPSDWTNHEVGIEVYGGNEARFLTVTGAHFEGSPLDVRPVGEGVLKALEGRYAKEKRKADVITLSMPDLLDEVLLPSIDTLNVPHQVRDFLATGANDGDRSRALFIAAVALYGAGLADDEVFSILAANPHALEIALDHRRQDHDRALTYIWREHCCKGKARAAERPLTTLADFDEVPAEEGARQALPVFERTDKGEILATKENVTLALRRPDVCGWELRHDSFRDEVMLAPPGTDEWRPFKDTDYMQLCIGLERGATGFKDIPKERIRDAVAYVAEAHSFDSARCWLETQEWDGVPRVASFLPRFFGTTDTPYMRAVGVYLWTALAGRIMVPGIKADMVPVAVGAQGSGKSSAVAAIVPSADFFLELDLGGKDDELARLMRGKLVIELGELNGLRAREAEHVKAFITRLYEEWVPKYREMQVRYARRCVFFGTTNKDEFLADDTGHRRWLPFRAGKCDPQGVIDNRDQLWAEGLHLFKANGVMWQDAEHLAKEEHEAFVVRDAWEEIVENWLNGVHELTEEKPINSPFTAVDALQRAIGMKPAQINHSVKERMAQVLKGLGPKLGFAARKLRVEGKQVRAYVRII